MKLGKHSYIAGEFKELGTPLEVGSFTQIGEDFFVHPPDNMATIEHPNLVSNFRFTSWDERWPYSGIGKGIVWIGNDVWIGRDVSILTGVRIGHGAVVGAHSVVTKDVPPYAVVAGNPAQVKKMRFRDDIVTALLLMRWWDWDDQVIKERLKDMVDPVAFITKYG